MRYRIYSTTVLALFLTSLMALSMCSQPYVVAQTNPNVRYGGTFIYGLLADPPHINPGITTELSVAAVGGSMYETLFNYDYDLIPQPNLAKDIVMDPDGMTYTVHLVENAQWTDGTPITSADVKFSYDEVYSKYHGKARSLWALEFLTVDKSITTPDDYTVVFKLNKPFLGFPSHGALNTLSILPKHIYEGTDILTNPHNKEPTVTSGPYKLSEWVKGDHITLVPNENWFRGKPYLDRIIFRIIPDPISMVSAIEKGEVHFLAWYVIPFSEVERLDADPNVVITWEGADPVWPIVDLGFNLREGRMTSDHRIREAFMRVIDREEINELVTFGVGRAGTSVMGHNDPYYDEGLPAFIEQLYGKTGSPENIEIAGDLLDDAGYPLKADGTRFTIDLLLRKDQPVQVKSGEIIREQMKAVGVDVNLRLLDVTAFTELTNVKWDYDLQIQWWTSVPDPTISVARLYHSKNILPIPAANSYGYNSPEADALLDSAAAEVDLSKRRQLWNQFQELIVTDLPKIVLWEYGQPQAYWHEFEDVDTYAYCHFNVRYVWWSGGEAGAETALGMSTMWLAAIVAVIVVAAGVILYTRRRKSQKAT